MKCLVNVCGIDHRVSEGRAYWSGILDPVAPLITAPRDRGTASLPRLEVIIVGWREKLNLAIMRGGRNSFGFRIRSVTDLETRGQSC